MLGVFQIKVLVHRVCEMTVRAVGGMLIYMEKDVAAFLGVVVINAPVVTMRTDARTGKQVSGL